MSCPKHTYAGDGERMMSMFVKGLNGRSVGCYAWCATLFVWFSTYSMRVNAESLEMSESEYPLASAYLSWCHCAVFLCVCPSVEVTAGRMLEQYIGCGAIAAMAMTSQ